MTVSKFYIDKVYNFGHDLFKDNVLILYYSGKAVLQTKFLKKKPFSLMITI